MDVVDSTSVVLRSIAERPLPSLAMFLIAGFAGLVAHAATKYVGKRAELLADKHATATTSEDYSPLAVLHTVARTLGGKNAPRALGLVATVAVLVATLILTRPAPKPDFAPEPPTLQDLYNEWRK